MQLTQLKRQYAACHAESTGPCCGTRSCWHHGGRRHCHCHHPHHHRRQQQQQHSPGSVARGTGVGAAARRAAAALLSWLMHPAESTPARRLMAAQARWRRLPCPAAGAAAAAAQWGGMRFESAAANHAQVDYCSPHYRIRQGWCWQVSEGRGRGVMGAAGHGQGQERRGEGGGESAGGASVSRSCRTRFPECGGDSGEAEWSPADSRRHLLFIPWRGRRGWDGYSTGERARQG